MQAGRDTASGIVCPPVIAAGDGEAAVGGVVQRVLAAGQRLDVPGDGVLGQPVRLLARQVGVVPGPGLDRQQVLAIWSASVWPDRYQTSCPS